MEHTINLELKLNDDAMIGNAMNKATEALNKRAEEIMKDWLDENKADLYEIIAKKVAASVMRSKKFRDILGEEIANE